MKANFSPKFRGILIFVLLTVLVTVIMGTVYGAVQQSYRSGANDPQIEATQSVADIIQQGAPLDQIVGNSDTIDLTKSLSVFVILLDKDGKVVGGTGKIDDKVPTPPQGVIDYVKAHDEERFTWEPKDGVRIAAVMTKVDDKGIVLAGRSLKEVELREKSLTMMVGLGWIISMVFVILLSLVLGMGVGSSVSNVLVDVVEVNTVEPRSEPSSEQDVV